LPDDTRWRGAALAALVLVVAGCAGGEPFDPGPSATVRHSLPVLPPLDRALGERALAHVEALVALGPRSPGTAARAAAADYLATQLTRRGLTVERDRWHDPTEHIDFENVLVRIVGRDPRTIVIGTHYDTKCAHGHDDPAHNFQFVGANDGGSGSGLLIELAAALHERRERLHATYLLAWFDGEESLTWAWNDARRALFGSRRLARQLAAAAAPARLVEQVPAMILLDMVGAAALSIDYEENSSPRLIDLTAKTAARLGHARHFFAGRTWVQDDHIPFKDLGVEVIDLIDIRDNPQWHTAHDTLEHLSADSMAIVGGVVLEALPAIEALVLR
jgi:hypothetical protein